MKGGYKIITQASKNMNKIKDKKKSLYKYISSKEKTGEEGNITDKGQSV